MDEEMAQLAQTITGIIAVVAISLVVLLIGGCESPQSVYFLVTAAFGLIAGILGVHHGVARVRDDPRV